MFYLSFMDKTLILYLYNLQMLNKVVHFYSPLRKLTQSYFHFQKSHK